MSDELKRLRAEIEALTPLVSDTERLRRENEILRSQLDGTRRRVEELTYQRDHHRYQLARMRARRFWRLAVATRDALRAPGRLLRFPSRAFQIIRGPGPKLPPEPAAQVEEAASPQANPLRAPAEHRRQLDLRRRFLPPPPPATTRDLRIAGILDTFSESCFAPECELTTTFRPDNWRETLEQREPHLLLVESAWKGNGGSWEYQVGSYSYAESIGLPHLTELVDWCRDQGIPTVFWNKEDPVHFDKFKDAASRFDVILTTDADRVEAYQQLADTQAEVVGSLPFAAQPRLHNPIGSPDRREPVPVFAGTYYRNRHPERREQLEMLLDAARPHGLVIFDRMVGAKTESTGFPDRFDPHIRGGLPYDQMVAAYRQYRLFLNTNSVTSSPTMFSRRVFELLASGTPVVSTPSEGMKSMLGSVVRTVTTPQEASESITELLHDDAVWDDVSQRGLSLVLSEHTYTQRLGTIARSAGLSVMDASNEPTTVLVLDDGGLVTAALGAFLAHAFPGSVALVGSSIAASGSGSHPLVTVVHQESADRVVRLRELADLAETDWVLVSDGSAAELGIARSVLTAKTYADADVIGIGQDAADSYGGLVQESPVAVRRSLLAAGAWSPQGDPRSVTAAAQRAGARVFSVSPRSWTAT